MSAVPLLPASPLVPFFNTKNYRGWPVYETGGAASYRALGDALTAPYRTDVHFAAYSAPSVPRRLRKEALDDGEHREALPDGVMMVAAVFDCDCEFSHRATGGDSAIPAADEWWLEQLAKLDALLRDHPGAYIYRTRGGYRIVYLLEQPFRLYEHADADAWTSQYAQWCAYLRRRYGIVADHGCADWQRLYRAPRATREGSAKPERRETRGDAHAIGLWSCEIAAEDVELAAKLKAKKPAKKKSDKPKFGSAPEYSGDGVLFQAFRARGCTGHEIEPGKWAIACPWEDSHTKGDRYDTSTVLYAPGTGETLGWFHCSHAHCQARSLRDVVQQFSEEELGAARAAAGVPEQTLSDASDDTRPEIVISERLDEMIESAIVALCNEENLYQRAGRLVQVVRDATARHERGTPRISAIQPARLRELLAKHARWIRITFKDGEERRTPAFPPTDVVSGVLARAQWERIRPLVGIAEAPMLLRDGSILQTPGYHADSGWLYEPSAEYLPVDDAPTIEDARRAFARLCEPFCDFPFDKPGLCKSIVVSAIMTPLARHAIEGATPMFVFDASTAGSGKSKAATIIALLPTGGEPARMPYSSNHEEQRKAISTIAQDGDSVVFIDNLPNGQAFGSPALDAALTTTVWKDRKLGANEQINAPLVPLWLATGNNIEPAGDLARRILHVRLEPKCERPEERTEFKYPNLERHVRECRTDYVLAALTILRAYCAAGRPSVRVRNLGSYEAWASLVAAALVWLGADDPVKGCLGSNVVTPTKSALRVLVEYWDKFDGAKRGERVSAIIDELYKPASRTRDGELPAPDPEHYGEMRDAIEQIAAMKGGKPDKGDLGRFLRSHRGTVVNGKTFVAVPGKGGVAKWRVVPVSEGGDRGDGWDPTTSSNSEKDAFSKTDTQHDLATAGRIPTMPTIPTLHTN